MGQSQNYWSKVAATGAYARIETDFLDFRRALESVHALRSLKVVVLEAVETDRAAWGNSVYRIGYPRFARPSEELVNEPFSRRTYYRHSVCVFSELCLSAKRR